MKEEKRKSLADKILEGLSERLKTDDKIAIKVESLADLPADKVIESLINQFDYILSGELKELIRKLIEQEIEAEEASKAEAESNRARRTEHIAPLQVKKAEEKKPEPIFAEISTESIMEIYGAKEHFPTESLDMEINQNDWFYLLGFCYAPDSTGHGIPNKRLTLKGVDGESKIILLDYGDVRFFIHQLQPGTYPKDNSGKLTLTPKSSVQLKYEHERTLNLLRSEEVLVTLPFWSIIQNLETLNKRIEDKYVDILRSLIDVHDAVEWDVEVFAFDQHMIGLPAIASVAKDRLPARESRHPVAKGRDVRALDKLLFREKSLAQEIHSQLLLHATKSKIDFMIRLDNAFMDDWKSILSSRYTVGKDKRKNFFKSVLSIQQEYEEYRLMVKVTSPSVSISF